MGRLGRAHGGCEVLPLAVGTASGFAVGTDDYVAKPFRREELIARVRRMLERTYGRDLTAAMENDHARAH